MSVVGRASQWLAAAGSGSFNFTVSSSVSSFVLRTAAIAAGWDQSAPLVCTVSGSVVLSGPQNGGYGVTISGSFPGGVTLINNGLIYGQGGSGGSGGNGISGTWGGSGDGGNSGGWGLYVTTACTVQNNGSIYGSGGGGGGGGSCNDSLNNPYNGGNGGNGADYYTAAGSGSAGQSGGGVTAGSGGNGGAIGSTGSAGTASADYYWTSGGGGGAEGYAVYGNSNITWSATGTRVGTIA